MGPKGGTKKEEKAQRTSPGPHRESGTTEGLKDRVPALLESLKAAKLCHIHRFHKRII